MRLILVFSCVFLFLQEPVLAQGKGIYEGKYVLTNDSISGNSTFSYFVKNRDTIKDGEFRFERTHLKPNTKNKTVVSVKLYGDFERGVKTGDWFYSRTTLEPGTNLRVNRYDVSYPGIGRLHRVKGAFIKDKADGPWQLLRKEVFEGEPTDTLKFAEIIFKNGFPKGRISIDSPEMKLQGSYNDNGFLDGIWDFEFQNDKDSIRRERRVYKEGWLVAHEIVFNEQNDTLEHPWVDGVDTLAVQDTIDIGMKYFEMLRLSKYIALNQNGNSQADVIVNAGDNSSNLILKTISDFLHDGTFNIWSSIGENTSEINFGQVIVNTYPYDSIERIEIDNIHRTIDALESQVHSFFENKYVEIGRYLYKDLSEVYKTFGEFRKNLHTYKEIGMLLGNRALENFPRNEVYVYLIPEVHYPDSVWFEYNDDSIHVKGDFPENLLKDSLKHSDIYNHFEQLREKVTALSQSANVLLDRTRRQSALSDLETEMSEKRDKVLRQFKGDADDFNSYHKEASDYVIGFANDVFKEYIRMDVEEKKEEIDDRIACFENLAALYEVMTRIPRNLDRIDEVYTRTVWNAFLMIDMDERVKERVYNAVIGYVYPFVIGNMYNQLECNEIQKRIHYLEDLYNRMISLRDQDTREIERSLRREKDPEVILEIIGL